MKVAIVFDINYCTKLQIAKRIWKQEKSCSHNFEPPKPTRKILAQNVVP